jgi:hypothetical protein
VTARSGSPRIAPSTFGRGLRSGSGANRLPTSNADAVRRSRSGGQNAVGRMTYSRSGIARSSVSRSGSSRFGGATGLVSGRVGTRSATGGTVRTRVGTRSGRVGRSYRIHSGHRHRHGHAHHGPAFGFYYAWNPYYVPYYRVYPRYGLYFGYGISYYGPAYETVFVDATDYYPSEVIVRETIVEERVVEQAPAPQVVLEGPAAGAPAQGGAFPPPAPQPDEAEGGEDAARAPHPDFEPAVKDFLGGRYQQALERLDRVLTAEPDNGEAWLAAMHANFALGRYGRAGTALSKAAALDAFPRGYRFDPRPLYEQGGNFDRAVKALDAHIAKKPKDADAVLVRAYLHVALGERAAAQDLIQTALQIRPEDETGPALALALLPAPPPPRAPVDGK